MKKYIPMLFIAALITACNTWGAPPQPFTVWTVAPSQTPGIVSATPFILPPPGIFTNTPTLTILTPFTPAVIETFTSTQTSTPAASETPVTPTLFQAVNVEILGCNTSIDIRNGMGEVTNAFVTIKNIGTLDLPNTCGLLRAIDEDREHPDKKRCVDNLPAQNQVTLKLTVDSHYQVDTFIQVDALSNDLVLLRLDQQSCRNIGLFGGEPPDIGIIKPIQ